MTNFVGGVLVSAGAVLFGFLLSAIPAAAARRRARFDEREVQVAALASIVAKLGADVLSLRAAGPLSQAGLDYVSPRIAEATGVAVRLDHLRGQAISDAAFVSPAMIG